MEQESMKIAGGHPAERLPGLRTLAAAWRGLAHGLGVRRRRMTALRPGPTAHEAARPVEGRRDCARCAGDFARAMTQVEATSYAKSQFIATVSHEFRTPLNAIIGFAQIMRDDAQAGGLSPLHADFLNEIYASGVHLMDIVNDILELSNIESGRREVVPEAVDLSMVFSACLRRHADAARDGDVALVVEIADDATGLYTDWAMLKRIVGHLLSNAVKFTPAGGRVTLWAGRRGDHVEITVQDNGVGIAPADLPHVFDAFWQAAPGISRTYEGTGLGLTVVKTLVELLGGRVRLDSEAGRGTTARISLPLLPASNIGTVAFPSAQ
jgi:signal transduction histidine kinase